MAQSRLIKLLNNDPNFFYYNGNNSGGVGNFTQKRIKYGNDSPDSGNSGEPYIQTPIPAPRSSNSVDDGFIRGGMTTANRASAIDKERIERFLKDKPKGTLFIQRQIKLQFTNPKLEVKKYGTNNVGLGIFNGLIDLGATVFNAVNELSPGPTRLYNNGLNTLAQVGVNAFGQHFNRHGITPVQDDNTKYFAVVKFNNEGGNNRLVSLKNKLIKVVEPPSNFLNSVNFIIGNINSFFGTNINTRALQAPDLIIDQYAGGPGSSYGQGRTLIRRFDITSNGYNKQQPVVKGTINYDGALGISKKWNNDISGNATVNNLLIRLNRPTSNEEKFIPGGSNNFAQTNQTATKYSGGMPAGVNGTSNSPTTRNYQDLIESINTTLTQNNFTTQNNSIDRTSPTYRYYGGRRLFDSNSVAIYTNTLGFDRHDPDIMQVIFQAIDPFGNDPTSGYHFRFPAYIKGFKDTFDATWNDYNYAGRSEAFYTYSKFKRNVSFNLDIPCFNKSQLFEKHRTLGQLASTTAGAYNNNGLLAGVILKVKLGNYLDDEYAILNSISYEIPEDSSWDIDEQLAMYLKASINLTIIHNNLPQYQVPEAESNTAGFFGYLKNPVKGYLDADYKRKYAVETPPLTKANTNVNRFNNSVNQEIIPGITPGFDPNFQTPLQKALNNNAAFAIQQANANITKTPNFNVNRFDNTIKQEYIPGITPGFNTNTPKITTQLSKFNQQSLKDLNLKSIYKKG
jgi:hypothetical protein